MPRRIFDVAVIGYGPVGMATAALLGRAGHSVVVLERYSGKYNLPRAAIFDDETMRTFAMLGIADSLLPKVHAQRRYEWRNAAGDLLIEHDFAAVGRSGWAEWYMMYQPDLEDALDGVCQRLPPVEVRFDARVTGIVQDDASVRLQIDGHDDVVARYAIACDGGNSFVRRALAVPMTDYGFSEPWLVCDFRLADGIDLPMARQVCDPAQPISIISLGPKHHRFSFMLNSEAESEAERQPARVWQRVAHYLQPGEAEIIRAATYTFRSLIANRWRYGRIMLAGDAAHQMPPFLGQGMCSGIRDALNLSLKLGLVLTARQPASTLDTYQSEREPHVLAVTRKGIELGRIQTTRDSAAAAARDRQLLANRSLNTAPEKIVFPPLGPGLLSDRPFAGELFVQGRVRILEEVDRFDALAGYGPVLFLKQVLLSELGPELAKLAASGIKYFIVPTEGPSNRHDFDVDRTYADWLRTHLCDAVAVRADFHVWGTASGIDGVRAMIAEFELSFADTLRIGPKLNEDLLRKSANLQARTLDT